MVFFEREGVVKIPKHPNDPELPVTLTVGTSNREVIPNLKLVPAEDPDLSLYRITSEPDYIVCISPEFKCTVTPMVRRGEEWEQTAPVIRMRPEKTYPYRFENFADDVVAIGLKFEYPSDEPIAEGETPEIITHWCVFIPQNADVLEDWNPVLQIQIEKEEPVEYENPILVPEPIVTDEVNVYAYELALESGYVLNITANEDCAVSIDVQVETLGEDGELVLEWRECEKYGIFKAGQKESYVINRNTSIEEEDVRAISINVYEIAEEEESEEETELETATSEAGQEEGEEQEPTEDPNGETEGEGETEGNEGDLEEDEEAIEAQCRLDFIERYVNDDAFLRSYVFYFVYVPEVLPEEEEDEEAEEPKYALTAFTKEYDGTTLTRIVALKDFANVRVGEMGGWVESELNLSHKGNCWIYDDAIVMDSAAVANNAQIRGEAVVKDNAFVGNDAKVMDEVIVSDDTVVTDHAMIRNFAAVCGESFIKGYTRISDCALVRDTYVQEHACVAGYAVVIHAFLKGHAYILDNAIIDKDVEIGGYSRIAENTHIIEKIEEPGTANVRLLEINACIDDDCIFCVPDVDDQRVFHTTAYAGDTVKFWAVPLDPRATVIVTYVGVDMNDDPSVCWPEDMIGQTDEIVLLVKNPHYPTLTGRYTIKVDILEKPVEEPDEPIEDNDTYLGIKSLEIAPYGIIEPSEDGRYQLIIEPDTTIEINAEPYNESDKVSVYVFDIDISDNPAMYFGEDMVNGSQEFTIIVEDEENPDNFKTYDLTVFVIRKGE